MPSRHTQGQGFDRCVPLHVIEKTADMSVTVSCPRSRGRGVKRERDEQYVPDRDCRGMVAVLVQLRGRLAVPWKWNDENVILCWCRWRYMESVHDDDGLTMPICRPWCPPDDPPETRCNNTLSNTPFTVLDDI